MAKNLRTIARITIDNSLVPAEKERTIILHEKENPTENFIVRSLNIICGENEAELFKSLFPEATVEYKANEEELERRRKQAAEDRAKAQAEKEARAKEAKRAAEEKARKEKEAKARREAEERAKKEEDKKRAQEEKIRAELEAKMRKEMEEKAAREAEEAKLKKEQEELEARIRAEVEAKIKAEMEAKKNLEVAAAAVATVPVVEKVEEAAVEEKPQENLFELSGLEDKVNEVKENAVNKVEEVKENIEEKVEDIKEDVVEKVEEVKKEVKDGYYFNREEGTLNRVKNGVIEVMTDEGWELEMNGKIINALQTKIDSFVSLTKEKVNSLLVSKGLPAEK